MGLSYEQRKNKSILKKRLKLVAKRRGPRVGDFLLMPNGKYTRFTYKWDDHIQTGGSARGGYYLDNGWLSYSGSLDSGVKLKDLIYTPARRIGWVWFFSMDIWTAHNSVEFSHRFRVYKLKKKADISGLEM